jgi:hypothetical protein
LALQGVLLVRQETFKENVAWAVFGLLCGDTLLPG